MTSQPPAITELSAAQVRKAVDLRSLDFTTTADLEPQTALVGQERATQALEMGIAMSQTGYNIFVSDQEGRGTLAQIAAMLQARAAALPTPGDWAYVHNFRQPDQPRDKGRKFLHLPFPDRCAFNRRGDGRRNRSCPRLP